MDTSISTPGISPACAGSGSETIVKDERGKDRSCNDFDCVAEFRRDGNEKILQITALSRLSRSSADGLAIIAAAVKAGWRVVCVRDGFDSDNAPETIQGAHDELDGKHPV